MGKRIAIIGAGIAGLSAGCYGRMNGYETEIFEMHTGPGGVCTGWTRKGFTFDGCLHWLTGSAPANPYYTLWQELGAVQGKRIIDHEVFGEYVTASGHRVTHYSSLNRFLETLAELAPEDRAALDQLKADARLYASMRRPLDAPRRKNPLAMLFKMRKAKPFIDLFNRYGPMTIEGFTEGLRSPILAEVFQLIVPFDGFPMVSILGLLALLDAGEAGWPEGGSLALARTIEKRYRDLGGAIHYGARVEEIVVRDGSAVGVRLADGSFHEADEVISAADGRSTIFGMLGGRYVNERIKGCYDGLPLYTPLMQVSFGVNRDMSGLPRLTSFAFANPMAVGGSSIGWAFLNIFGFDPTMAPRGKTAVTVNFWASFDYWEDLAKDSAAYLAEKKRVEADVMKWIDTLYPGIAADVEVTDVATPMTTLRYTGNYRASYEGFRPTVKTMRMKLDTTLPGVRSFSMIGQWTAPFAGLPTVAHDGRRVIQTLCRQDRKRFVTTVP
jgi:phytoene dehydrogenase-like protein